MSSQTDNAVSAQPVQPAWRLLIRTAIVAGKLVLVYLMSLQDAQFFYQQF